MKIKKMAKKLRKTLKGCITIPNLISFAETLGYSTVFFNTDEGDEILNSFGLTSINEKSFVYCGATKVLFIDNDLYSQGKIYCMLHELGHILLNHLDDDKMQFMDTYMMENEAEAFVYAVLNYKRDYKLLYTALCLILISALSITIGYSSRSDTETHTLPTVTTPQNITTTEATVPPVDNVQSELVYVTKTGTRYHKADCRYVRNNKTSKSITAEEAKTDYTPCKVCNP